MTEQRFDEIDSRLENLEVSLIGYRNQQRNNADSINTLQNLTSELLDIARLHQQALRLSQEREQEDREEIRRIWEYLLGQQRNGNGGRNN